MNTKLESTVNRTAEEARKTVNRTAADARKTVDRTAEKVNATADAARGRYATLVRNARKRTESAADRPFGPVFDG